MADLEWKGPEVIARVQKCARIGINRTMAECVLLSKATHPFTNRTGNAERSIRIILPAQTSAGSTVGFWGSVTTNYFGFLEFGTKITRGRVSIVNRFKLFKNKKALSGRKVGKTRVKDRLPWKGGSWAPTLRPVAEKVYPRLFRHIGEAWGSSA